MTDNPLRARVQGYGRYWIEPHESPDDHPPGTISWEEHEEAWREYCKRFSTQSQSALDIHNRGGFGYWELVGLLGRVPATWKPMPDATGFARRCRAWRNG